MKQILFFKDGRYYTIHLSEKQPTVIYEYKIIHFYDTFYYIFPKAIKNVSTTTKTYSVQLYLWGPSLFSRSTTFSWQGFSTPIRTSPGARAPHWKSEWSQHLTRPRKIHSTRGIHDMQRNIMSLAGCVYCSCKHNSERNSELSRYSHGFYRNSHAPNGELACLQLWYFKYARE